MKLILQDSRNRAEFYSKTLGCFGISLSDILRPRKGPTQVSFEGKIYTLGSGADKEESEEEYDPFDGGSHPPAAGPKVALAGFGVSGFQKHLLKQSRRKWSSSLIAGWRCRSDVRSSGFGACMICGSCIVQSLLRARASLQSSPNASLTRREIQVQEARTPALPITMASPLRRRGAEC